MLRSTIYLWVFVASAGLAVICLLLHFVFATVFFSLFSIVFALLIISLSCLSSAGCERIKEHGRLPKLMLTGVVASWLACLTWLVPALEVVPAELYEATARLASIPSIWVATVLISGYMLLQQIKSPVIRKLRLIAIISVILLAIQSLSWIWLTALIAESPGYYPRSSFQTSMTQVFGILAVLACCLTITTAIFARLKSIAGEEISEEERLSFQAQCPRCTRKQPMKTSGDACSNCGLRIKVSVY